MWNPSAHFQMLATYNTRANAILYQAIADLCHSEYRKPREAFFASIQGTLNHLLVGDGVCMTRFEGAEAASTDLDAIPYRKFLDLRNAREVMDKRIARFVAERVDDAFLDAALVHVNTSGTGCADLVHILLSHFFNHQTHHRGQVHGMLSQIDVAPPSLDLHRVVL
jgi:uncharacterized damage-inducible protein DinB